MPRPCENLHEVTPTCHICRIYLQYPHIYDNPLPTNPSLVRTPQILTPPRPNLVNQPACRHLGPVTSESILCQTCARGKTRLKVFQCEVYGKCILGSSVQGIRGCNGCPSYEVPTSTISAPIVPTLPPSHQAEALVVTKQQEVEKRRQQRAQRQQLHQHPLWAYGITTIPERLTTYFPRTLESLRAAGFDKPYIFVDGEKDPTKYHTHLVSLRQRRMGVVGNWMLSLMELYLLNPYATRYALFQDDILCSLNLRTYLERTTQPENGYLNLYNWPDKIIKGQTDPGNESLVPKDDQGNPVIGWYEARRITTNSNNEKYKTLQRGLGAVALIFTREQVQALLSSRPFINKPLTARHRTTNVDGGIVNAMNLAGYRELVHYPSLVQHIGVLSTTGHDNQPESQSWRGESFDCLKLLK